MSERSLVAKISDSANKIYCLEKYDITLGTAQGSCLGPLLFMIFCNGIHQLNLFGRLILFADDTTLINTHCNKKYLEYQMHHDMKNLIDWFRVNKLSLNIGKTVLMQFWSGDKKQTMEFKLEGLIIPEVSHTKFLVVHLDNELNWEYHIN